MQITPINTYNNNNTFGRKKIPRYLYHLTGARKYNSMLQDGIIKTSDSDLYTQGVFMIELDNFFKKWKRNSSWDNSCLQDDLIRQAASWTDNLVLLKIPTQILNSNQLKIRSQNIFFEGKDIREAQESLTCRKNGIIAKRKLSKSDVDNHLKGTTPATNARKYKNKGDAIEYIYANSIPISKVEKMGEINIRELKKAPNFNPEHKIHDIFASLFSGKSEEKGTKLIDT
jgi:Holliday junction resolvase RusA-like endonuclease